MKYTVYRHPLLQTPTITGTSYYRQPLLQTPPITDTSYYRQPLLQAPIITDTLYYRHPLLQAPTITDTHYYRHPLLQATTITDTHYYRHLTIIHPSQVDLWKLCKDVNIILQLPDFSLFLERLVPGGCYLCTTIHTALFYHQVLAAKMCNITYE